MLEAISFNRLTSMLGTNSRSSGKTAFTFNYCTIYSNPPRPPPHFFLRQRLTVAEVGLGIIMQPKLTSNLQQLPASVSQVLVVCFKSNTDLLSLRILGTSSNPSRPCPEKDSSQKWSLDSLQRNSETLSAGSQAESVIF